MMKLPRLLLTLCLLMAACSSCIVRRSPASNAEPLFFYAVNPPPVYQQWLIEVTRCAAGAASIDTTFVVERIVQHVDSIVWLAVPTEEPDGRFRAEPIGSVSGYHTGGRADSTGQFSRDTIGLSGQGLLVRRLVKHELLHAIVRSQTEFVIKKHGRPWGFCEYY